MDKELEKRLDGMEDRLSAKVVDSVKASEKRLVATISDVVTLIDNRFNKVDERFEKIDERFEQVDVRFERIEERLNNIDEKLDPLVNQVSNQEKRLSFIEEKVL